MRQGLTYTSANSARVGQIWGAGGGDLGGVAVLRLGAGQPRTLAVATGNVEGRVRVYPPDPQSTPGLFQLRGPGRKALRRRGVITTPANRVRSDSRCEAVETSF